MALEIVWSPSAIQSLQKTIEYLDDNASEKILRDFAQNLDNKLSLLSISPQMYSQSEIQKDVRRCLLNSNLSLYYRVKNKQIEIITLFDNRQNPENLKNILLE